MTLRILPAEEYPRLHDVADGICPDPAITRVVVAEENGEIVGRTMLMAPAHIEGTWVKEDHRNTFLGKRLLERIESEAKTCGLSKVFAYADNPKVSRYLMRVGYRLCPMSVYQKEL